MAFTVTSFALLALIMRPFDEPGVIGVSTCLARARASMHLLHILVSFDIGNLCGLLLLGPETGMEDLRRGVGGVGR